MVAVGHHVRVTGRVIHIGEGVTVAIDEVGAGQRPLLLVHTGRLGRREAHR